MKEKYGVFFLNKKDLFKRISKRPLQIKTIQQPVPSDSAKATDHPEASSGSLPQLYGHTKNLS
jgi:hypothetical protein